MGNHLKIIEYLGRNPTKEFTMLELSKILSIPYASFHRTVQKMQDLLAIKSIGTSKVISLQKSNHVLTSYLTIASDERKKTFLKRQPIIRKITSELISKDIVLLFGSYAQGTQHTNSDIDILVINNNGKKSLSFSKYELLFKVKINPIFITRKELRDMIQAHEENVGKQALNNHIILQNPTEFWRNIYEV